MADSDGFYTDLKWSASEYSIKHVIDKFSLPQLVKVEEGYMLTETVSLGSGQLMTIHSWKTITQFKGFDSMGRDVIIPTTCPFKVKLATQNQGKTFKSVRELCEVDPRPKYVEVKLKKKIKDPGKDNIAIKNGDKLKVVLIERTPNGPSCMHFRNEQRKHLRLPVEFCGEFKPCPEDTKEYLLSDLIGREFPIFVQFITDGANKKMVDKSIGVIQIRGSETTDLVFATTRDSSGVNLLAFPLSLDVKIRTAQETSENKTEYARLCDITGKGVDVKKLQRQISTKNPVESKEVYITSYAFEALKAAEAKMSVKNKSEKAQQSPSRTIESGEMFEFPIDSELPGLPKEDYGLSFYEKPLQSNSKARRKSSDKATSPGILSRVRSKLKRNSKKSSTRASESRKIDKLQIEVMHQHNDNSSDGGDSGIYEEIPTDVYMSMDVLNGMKRAYSTHCLAKPLKGTNKKFNRTKSESNPPPLPGNHPASRAYQPVTRRFTVPSNSGGGGEATRNEEIEKQVFKKFYDTLKRSEQEITCWKTGDLNRTLTDLQLTHYIDTFSESQIDGKLLVDLDEAIFKDLGLNPFEARKLRKFVFGWRPDMMKTYQYMSAKKVENKEPCDWTEDDVVYHLNQLGMEAFASFCKSNQINGDLLRDIVVDNEVLGHILKGKDKRLNSVKLKNYVIDGWRPKDRPKQSVTTQSYINARPLSAQHPGGSGRCSTRDKTKSESFYVSPTRIESVKGDSATNEIVSQSSSSQSKLQATRSLSSGVKKKRDVAPRIDSWHTTSSADNGPNDGSTSGSSSKSHAQKTHVSVSSKEPLKQSHTAGSRPERGGTSESSVQRKSKTVLSKRNDVSKGADNDKRQSTELYSNKKPRVSSFKAKSSGSGMDNLKKTETAQVTKPAEKMPFTRALNTTKQNVDCAKKEIPVVSNIKKQYEDKQTTKQSGNEREKKHDLAGKKNFAKFSVGQPSQNVPKTKDSSSSVAQIRKKFDGK